MRIKHYEMKQKMILQRKTTTKNIQKTQNSNCFFFS